ncbi:MAG: desulfoferrodoxin family protein [Methanomethylovorans sp.]|uniref:desulfoferrodoxin family protein n=1 Tax=Methanomethylovorans sp. TaxID=2758717 RepID=UPI003C76857E
MIDKKKINKAADPAHLTGLEKEHVPVIEAPELVLTEQPFTVKVTVPHVMEQAHYIEWIKLSMRGRQLGEVKFSLSDTSAVAEFTVTIPEEVVAMKALEVCNIHGVNVCGDCGTKSVFTDLIALVGCNVHGLWEGFKHIEIMSKVQSTGKPCKWKD